VEYKCRTLKCAWVSVGCTRGELRCNKYGAAYFERPTSALFEADSSCPHGWTGQESRQCPHAWTGQESRQCQKPRTSVVTNYSEHKRMPSGPLYRVALVRTNVWENVSSSYPRFLSLYQHITLKNPEDGEETFSETSVRCRPTLRKVPEGFYNRFSRKSIPEDSGLGL
jgi:hypothetical protein